MSLSDRDPEAAYYQAVEEYFVSRRGDPLLLSNADWTLVRRWRTAGIPLRVVLRGIRDALDAHAHGWSRERKVGSLAYCAREVERARERRESALGHGAGTSAETRAALDGFARALASATDLGPRARVVADEIARELGGGGPLAPEPGAARQRLEELTRWLADRETRLVDALQSEEPEERRRARENELEDALRPWRERMPARVLAQLRRESLVRRVLESHRLPRLSLFHVEGDWDAPS